MFNWKLLKIKSVLRFKKALPTISWIHYKTHIKDNKIKSFNFEYSNIKVKIVIIRK